MFLGIIFGIFLYAVAIPIIGQLVELICTIIESTKMKFHYKITKMQKEIEEELSADGNVVSYPIGFQMPSEEEYYEEEDDD